VNKKLLSGIIISSSVNSASAYRRCRLQRLSLCSANSYASFREFF